MLNLVPIATFFITLPDPPTAYYHNTQINASTNQNLSQL